MPPAAAHQRSRQKGPPKLPVGPALPAALVASRRYGAVIAAQSAPPSCWRTGNSGSPVTPSCSASHKGSPPRLSAPVSHKLMSSRAPSTSQGQLGQSSTGRDMSKLMAHAPPDATKATEPTPAVASRSDYTLGESTPSDSDPGPNNRDSSSSKRTAQATARKLSVRPTPCPPRGITQPRQQVGTLEPAQGLRFSQRPLQLACSVARRGRARAPAVCFAWRGRGAHVGVARLLQRQVAQT